MIIQSITQITSIRRPRYLIIYEIIRDNFLYSVTSQSKIIEAYIIGLTLLITYLLTARISRLCFRVESSIHQDILNLPRGRYLVVANHIKAIDPYLLLAALPYTTFKNLLPIRFFTANIYLKKWWHRILLRAFGCFRAYSVEGKISGVKGGLYLSDLGQSLLIFPEGKRNRFNSKIEIKIGAAYLAQRRDFTILPVFVSYVDKNALISWGKPFSIHSKTKTEDLNKLSKLIFHRVLKMSNKENA